MGKCKPPKYYAVKRGRKTGVFMSWEECRDMTDGYPNAVFKSFPDKGNALKYLAKKDVPAPVSKADVNKLLDDGVVVAYTDGSYDSSLNLYGAGAYILIPNGGVKKISTYGDDRALIAHRNITGELFAAIQAIDWAIENGYRAIRIVHDYAGVKEWADGNWTARKKLTRDYQDAIREKRKLADISFSKVKGHSGDKYNEYADACANKGITERRNKIHGNLLDTSKERTLYA